MPTGILGLLAMPFGLDGFFWRLMDYGIEWMTAVALWGAQHRAHIEPCVIAPLPTLQTPYTGGGVHGTRLV